MMNGTYCFTRIVCSRRPRTPDEMAGARRSRGRWVNCRNRPHPTSLGLTTSLVEGGATDRAELYRGLERFRLSVALMWFSSSVGATGRLVRPAYRTPFGVSKPTIWGRATAARTARRLWPHSTIWQYGRAQLNGCLPSCRVPPRPTRSWFETLRVSSSRKTSGLSNDFARSLRSGAPP